VIAFLNAALLGGLLAVSIPVVIHLFHKSKFRVVPWGAMHLLEAVLRKNTRRLKLEQLLLLLLRCSIPVALALLMARPVLRGLESLIGDAKTSTVVVLDNSYSMEAGGLNRSNYLQAREAAARFATSSIPEVQKGAEDLKVAARRRLELFEVPESFILELERRGTAHPHVTMEALVSGYVTGKEVREGQHVTPGAELYTVTDLSRVWVEADFYENEARLVRPGQPATLSLPFARGRTLAANVTYVYPYLELATRTLKVRFDVPNADLALKPSMYIDVVLAVDAAPSVTVPASAVLDSGVRKIVFVETRPNHFEPRGVEVGLHSADRVEVVSGVQAGERVVVRANFLLDSESRLRGALSGTIGDHQHGGEP